MPSIYGSSEKERFLEFRDLNTKRKKYDSSFIFLNNDYFDIHKFHEKSVDFKFKRKKYNILMGLSIESSKKIDLDYMDPLVSDSWVVSSYGDILNANEIIDNDDIKKQKNISSDIISILLEYSKKNYNNDVKIISEALCLIDGSYSAWLYNFQTGNAFIAKCGHELHADVYNNDYSTLQFEGSEPLNDGEIYQLTREGITHVGIFDYSDQ